ncbi:MAG TPA: hypothetical protein VE913_14805 [Longimicrobium sp.]|nr:hypothetical protein [Longimicrobium sp.]
MTHALRFTAIVPLLVLAACKAEIPRSPAPWMTIGASRLTVTAMDTSRIGKAGSARLVWLRIETKPDTAAGQPAAPPKRVESHHRIDCGARVVEDLGPAGAPAARHPFDTHPHGKRVFPTVCNAIGLLPAR